MKKIISVVLILLAILVSCSDQDDKVDANSVLNLQDVCSAEDPIKIE